MANGEYQESDFIFLERDGGVADTNHFRGRTWEKASALGGLPHRWFHDLRQDKATPRMSQGDNMAAVSKQLGHHPVKFTLDSILPLSANLAGQGRSQRAGGPAGFMGRLPQFLNNFQANLKCR